MGITCSIEDRHFTVARTTGWHVGHLPIPTTMVLSISNCGILKVSYELSVVLRITSPYHTWQHLHLPNIPITVGSDRVLPSAPTDLSV